MVKTTLALIHAFFSYAHLDEGPAHDLLVRLRARAAADSRFDLDIFDDRQLLYGRPWDKGLRSALGRSPVGLLSISAPLLASDYVQRVELHHFAMRPDKVLVPIGLGFVNLRAVNLGGLDPASVLLFPRADGSAAFFKSLTEAEKDEFVDQIVEHIYCELQRKGLA